MSFHHKLRRGAVFQLGGSLYTFVGSDQGAAAASAGTETVNFSFTALQDDIILVLQGRDGTPSVPSGYTDIFTTGSNPGMSSSWKRMGATPDTSVGLTRSSTRKTAYIVLCIRGINTTTAIDVTDSSASGNGSSPDSPSITTVTDGALVGTFFSLDDDETTVSATPSGYSNMYEQNTNGAGALAGATIGVAFKEKDPAGAENPGAWSLGSSDQWGATTFAFRPAA